MARETSAQLTQARADVALLKLREDALRAVGATDLADIYKRARREFETDTFHGMVNTEGVNHHGVRK